jgi:hypothetical protein
MNTYCDLHRRKYVGQACPWCRETKPDVTNAESTIAVSQTDVTNNKPPMTNSVRAIYRYRDPDKWRTYMREYMRQKRAGGSP